MALVPMTILINGKPVRKPKLSINELAAKRSRCAKLRAEGKPCNEFAIKREVKSDGQVSSAIQAKTAATRPELPG